MNERLPKFSDVRILFICDGYNQWYALLCHDPDLEASDILNYFTRRWVTKVFFKDAARMLYLGNYKCNTLDAVVVSYSKVLIQYLFACIHFKWIQLHRSYKPSL